MITLIKNFRYLIKKLPSYYKAHWLLRIPLAIVFIQQGINKLPVTPEGAEASGLPYFVWFFVAWSELFAGIGLLIGGLVEKHWLNDIITRLSGIVMVVIVSGVIIISESETFLDVLLHDNLHVFFHVVGLFFVLKGNWVS